MYLVAIAWLYVTLLMAAAERNVVSGVMTFLLYGLGPLALFLWLFGTPQRARLRAIRERQRARDDDVGLASQPDGGGHPTADPIAPVGEEPGRIGRGAQASTVDRSDA